MKNLLSRDRLLQASIVVCCLVFLLIQAYTGSFSRYIADDYCLADVAIRQGVIDSSVWWYNHWTGRFTFNAIMGLMGVVGEESVAIFPLLVLGLCSLALTWTLYQVMQLLDTKRPFYAAAVMSGLIAYTTFAGAPNIVQSLYWVGGSTLYTTPLIGLILTTGIVVYALRCALTDASISPFLLIAQVIITFVAGGSSEVYGLLQVAVLTLTAFGVLTRAPATVRKRMIGVLAMGLLGAVLALVIMFIAPGNASRQATVGAPLPIMQWISRTLVASAAFIATDIAIHAPVALFVALVMSATVAARIPDFELPYRLMTRQVRGLLGLSAGIALLLIIGCIAPPLYAYVSDAIPPDRVLFIPHFILICTAAFWGGIMGMSFQRGRGRQPVKAIALVIVVLLAIGPIMATWNTLQRIPQYSTYAVENDRRDQAIRAAATNGVQDIVVSKLKIDMAHLAGLDIISGDSSAWVNVCAASYYGVRSLIAVERVDG